MQSQFSARGMWADALDLLDQADRLHRQFSHLGARRAGPPCWEPPIDMYESQGELWIYYALPGVQPAQLQVQLEGDVLVVRGERRLPPTARHAAIHRLEIPYGHFERRVALTVGCYELLEHELDNGCLVIGLRRTG